MVRQSVSHASFHTSHHYFFLIFGMKLVHDKCRKVTEPDFWKKNFVGPNGPKWAEMGRKWQFFELCRKLRHQFFLIFCMKIGLYKGYHVVKTACSKIILRSSDTAQNGPRFGGVKIGLKWHFFIFCPKTAEWIFLIFGIKLDIIKGYKLA